MGPSALNCNFEMYCQWRRRCKPIERKRQWGWDSFLSFAVLRARYIFDESHSSALECKVGGKFHVKVNILLRLIANKYHEGNMKRTLKRELKESAFAEQKANRIDLAWWDCCVYSCISMLDVGAMVLALNVSFYFCKSLPLHMNGNLPAGIGMHVFAMICDLIHVFGGTCVCSFVKGEGLLPWAPQALAQCCWQNVSAWPVLKHGPRSLTDVQVRGWTNLFAQWKYWLGYLHQQPTD